MFVLENPSLIVTELILISETEKQCKAELKELRSINVYKHSIQAIEKEILIAENKKILSLLKEKRKKVSFYFNNCFAMN